MTCAQDNLVRTLDRAWQRLRAAKLATNPWCEIGTHCKDLPITKRVATEVDHIVPISKGGARLAPANFQSSCAACHSWKTAVMDGALRT